MTKLAIVIGSARTGRVADKVLNYVKKEVETRDSIDTTIVDLAEYNLPYFNGELTPSDPAFAIQDEAAMKWSNVVKVSDAVLFITPEYNHTLAAIQKNAIDWLYPEWENKPVSATAYGWTGGSLSVATFNEVLGHLKADVRTHALLPFMQDLNPDGSLLNGESVETKLKTQLDALLS